MHHTQPAKDFWNSVSAARERPQALRSQRTRRSEGCAQVPHRVDTGRMGRAAQRSSPASTYKDEQSCALLRDKPKHTIGILGNSITAGVGVRDPQTDGWPAQLARLVGGKLKVLNRAVRASRADLATLCSEELFNHSWPDLAIVDYSFTSDSVQVAALIDRLHASRVPTMATLYCHSPEWLSALRCGFNTFGQGEAKKATGAKLARCRSATAAELSGGAGLRAGFGSSLDPRAWPASEGNTTSFIDRLPEASGARREFDRLRGIPSVVRRQAERHYLAAAHATASTEVAESAELALAATALAWMDCVKSPRSKSCSAGRARPLAQHLSEWVHNRTLLPEAAWLSATTALAAGCCIDGYRAVNMVRTLEMRRVPYVTNAGHLVRHALDVEAWAGHPNQLGHQFIAEPVAQLLRSWCFNPPSQVQPVVQTVCRFGANRVNALLSSGDSFNLVEPEGSRTGGVGSSVRGALASLRLASESLAAGFLTLGYERSHRNRGVHGRVECKWPCVCQPLQLDAFNTRPFSGTTFNPSPVWVKLGNATDGAGYECTLEARVTELQAGRLLIQAVTLAAPLPGNRSTLVTVGGRGLASYLEGATQSTAF